MTVPPSHRLSFVLCSQASILRFPLPECVLPPRVLKHEEGDEEEEEEEEGAGEEQKVSLTLVPILPHTQPPSHILPTASPNKLFLSCSLTVLPFRRPRV